MKQTNGVRRWHVRILSRLWGGYGYGYGYGYRYRYEWACSLVFYLCLLFFFLWPLPVVRLFFFKGAYHTREGERGERERDTHMQRKRERGGKSERGKEKADALYCAASCLVLFFFSWSSSPSQLRLSLTCHQAYPNFVFRLVTVGPVDACKERPAQERARGREGKREGRKEGRIVKLRRHAQKRTRSMGIWRGRKSGIMCLVLPSLSFSSGCPRDTRQYYTTFYYTRYSTPLHVSCTYYYTACAPPSQISGPLPRKKKKAKAEERKRERDEEREKTETERRRDNHSPLPLPLYFCYFILIFIPPQLIIDDPWECVFSCGSVSSSATPRCPLLAGVPGHIVYLVLLSYTHPSTPTHTRPETKRHFGPRHYCAPMPVFQSGVGKGPGRARPN